MRQKEFSLQTCVACRTLQLVDEEQSADVSALQLLTMVASALNSNLWVHPEV